MSYTLVPARYKFSCKRCKSLNMEYKEDDVSCDINYRCLSCGYSWWVDGSDY